MTLITVSVFILLIGLKTKKLFTYENPDVTMQHVKNDFKNNENTILDLADFGWMFAVKMIDPTIAKVEAFTYSRNREE